MIQFEVVTDSTEQTDAPSYINGDVESRHVTFKGGSRKVMTQKSGYGPTEENLPANISLDVVLSKYLDEGEMFDDIDKRFKVTIEEVTT